MAKYEDAAKQRIKKGLARYKGIIAKAEEVGFNEADTSAIVNDILADLLGYDKFFEVTSEYQVKGKYADYGIKVDGQLQFFVEVKAIGEELRERHLFQVVAYSANQGLEWTVLTNARIWQCHHIAKGQPMDTDVAFAVDLLDNTEPVAEKVGKLFLISREGLSRGHLDDYWAVARALSPVTLGEALLSERVLKSMRLRIRETTGQRLDVQAISNALAHKVIRPNVREQVEVREPAPRRRRKRSLLQDGYPAKCFAYVPDGRSPESWQLRFRDKKGRADADAVEASVAALVSGEASPSGETIPPEALDDIRADLAAAYRELGRAEEDIPQVLRAPTAGATEAAADSPD